jgi:hypothetical protein
MADEVALGGDHTLPMSVANIGFMLDRLGKDCSPLQFLRELTQNSIEAIRAGEEDTGAITWDVDWAYFDLEGVYKVSITDDGVGMTGEEMVRYINQLSSSMHEQSHSGNFGVGAKVAAATRNHYGLIYLSWKDGVGYTVHLWRDPETGEYGLRQFQLPDGDFAHWGRLEDTVKPEEFDQHGTRVVLLGNTAEQNTMTAPEGTASPSRWISRYLNTRYYRFPDGINVRAREGWESPREDKDRNVLRSLTGQEAYLASHAQESGSVELRDAVVHWWVLRDEPALTQNSGFVASSGHIAALYQDELYEMLTSRAGVARLQQFGVIFGPNRVVLYVEPLDGAEFPIESNTARTALLRGNEPLPWADWAVEFRDNMPDEIKAMMDEVVSGSSSADHRQAIRERLKLIADLFRLSRYRPTPKGVLQMDDENVTAGGKARSKSGRNEAEATSRSGGTGGRAGSVYGLFLADDGGIAAEAMPGIEPMRKWVSVEDGTRTQGDLEDRAAKYLADQNLLLINADFRVFVDMVERWTTMYEHAPGAEQTVTEVVREWFEQTLVETIMGLQSLRGSQQWDIASLARAWDEEALTSAVMPRYHTDIAVKRSLGAKLGTLKQAAS